jgi:hypothetical protein
MRSATIPTNGQLVIPHRFRGDCIEKEKMWFDELGRYAADFTTNVAAWLP